MIKNKKKFVLLLVLLTLLAAACAKVQLQQTVPTSPKESYEQLPQ
jgi:outer membrane biogenesis lipoprotein LolB